jgi:hypothetical protein
MEQSVRTRDLTDRGTAIRPTVDGRRSTEANRGEALFAFRLSLFVVAGSGEKKAPRRAALRRAASRRFKRTNVQRRITFFTDNSINTKMELIR